MDAVERLLDDRDMESITVADIAAEARASVGSFYARFTTKEDAIRGAVERFYAMWDEMLSGLTRSPGWREADIIERLDRYVEGIIAICSRSPGLARLIQRHRFLGMESFVADEAERGTALTVRILDPFRDVESQIASAHPHDSLAFVIRGINGIVMTTLVMQTPYYGAIETKDLRARLVDLFGGYLKHGGIERPSG